MLPAFKYLALVFVFLFMLAFIYIVSSIGATVVNGFQAAYNTFIQSANGTNGIYIYASNSSAYTGLNTSSWQSILQGPFGQILKYLPIVFMVILIAALVWTYRRT